MKYSAGQAAKACGVSTATITRALKSGRISGQKDDSGAWVIDPAELHRVFPPLAQQEDAAPSSQGTASGDALPAQALEHEVRLLREALDDARHERDRWREMAERLSLAPPRSSEPEPGFWGRLFGKR